MGDAESSGSPGSVAADTDRPGNMRRAVSPTTHDKWRNTLAPILKPVACWRIHHAYFRFDSSVILPEIAGKLTTLKPLITEDRVATIFGHADPVGTVDYNSHLSARRARALFALLTRNADIWLHLFGDRQPYDQWGLSSTQIFLAALQDANGNAYYGGAIDGAFGPETDRAIRAFQREEHDEDTGKPLAADGVAGPKTRKRLYARYMDALSGTPGQPMMRPDQFLGDPAENAKPDGKCKGAFQGCSEYNPSLLLSDADEKRYAKQQDKTERNASNAPNRRAMIFFFSKRQLLPLTPDDALAAWPCPTWDEGGGPCKAQFWPDSDQRVANGQDERRYEKGDETMACSWYDRLARLSPCEGDIPVRRPVRVLDFNLQPAAGRRCEATVRGLHQATTTNDDGVAFFDLPRRARSCDLRWAVDSSNARFTERKHVSLLPMQDDATAQRLENLAYSQATLEDKVRAYQREVGHPETGVEADVASEIAAWHDGGENPNGDAARGGPDLRLAAAPGPGGQIALPSTSVGTVDATAAPQVRVELYQDPSGRWAPAHVSRDSKKALWRLDVLRGTHSALTFVGAAGLTLRSNNPDNAVSNDSDIWIDSSPNADRRTVFFHARRTPATGNAAQDHCAIIEASEGTAAGRAVVQVWVRDIRQLQVILRLHGPSMCLNAEDLHPAGYRLSPFTHRVSDDSQMTAPERASTAPLNPSKPNSPARVIAQILTDVAHFRAAGDPNAVLNHLVINCHGFQMRRPDGTFEGWIRLGHDWDYWKNRARPTDRNGLHQVWNIGFSRYNVDLFDALRGCFRYIWIQGCDLGSDATLCSEIARRTAATVTAPAFATAEVTRMKPGHIDYPHASTTIHWNPSGTLIPAHEFFRHARHAALPDLEESLFFNVAEGRRV